VIAALRPPVRRISIAIALSAMIHAAILWLPHLQLPHEKVILPPLTARLEFLPKTADKPAAKPEPPNRLSKPGDGPSAKKIADTANTIKEMEKSAAAPLFPKHLQLTFTVYEGTDLTKTGELHQQLDIDGDNYTLTATRQAVGPTILLNNDRLIRTSYGKIDEHGLQPDTFKEEKISGTGKQDRQATFDRTAQKLLFSNGGDTALPADAQDILSFTYQLSQLSMHAELIPLSISDGAQLEPVQIEIGSAEDISTPMGPLRALHLRKMHAQGEAYFEIWLGMEYRLLPVKFRQLDGSDKVTEEFVISDIRAADE